MIRLLKEMTSGTIVSLDNMNDYYEVSLKEWRLAQVETVAKNSHVEHIFVKGSISDKEMVDELFEKYSFDVVVNLAAQAGVRYSIDHPDIYIESNIIGFYINIGGLQEESGRAFSVCVKLICVWRKQKSSILYG